VARGRIQRDERRLEGGHVDGDGQGSEIELEGRRQHLRGLEGGGGDCGGDGVGCDGSHDQKYGLTLVDQRGQRRLVRSGTLH
jgi:hypothetical protein